MADYDWTQAIINALTGLGGVGLGSFITWKIAHRAEKRAAAKEKREELKKTYRETLRCIDDLERIEAGQNTKEDFVAELNERAAWARVDTSLIVPYELHSLITTLIETIVEGINNPDNNRAAREFASKELKDKILAKMRNDLSALAEGENLIEDGSDSAS